MALEQIVNRVSEQLSQVLPPGVRQLRGDIEENIKVVLREALARMELLDGEAAIAAFEAVRGELVL